MFFLIITMLIKYKRKFKNETTSFNAQVKKMNLAMNVYIHFFSFFLTDCNNKNKVHRLHCQEVVLLP